MPENRKYLPEEITYVISRTLAGWKHEAIAEAFKRDHAPYWDHKEFTRKQVSYIRNTYKIPPGSIAPYQEPEPDLGLQQQEYQQQSIADISPLTRLLMMDNYPTPQPDAGVAGGQASNENHLEGGHQVAPSNWSNNNDMIESVNHEQPDFYTATIATGFTTGPQAFGTPATDNNGFALNAGNGLTDFNSGFGAGGGMSDGTGTNQPSGTNANPNEGNLFGHTTAHGIGEHFQDNNAHTSADGVAAPTAEVQAFLDGLLPAADNGSQQTIANAQTVAPALQGLSTAPSANQPQAQEDTVMHCVEPETVVDLTSDGNAQAPAVTTAVAAATTAAVVPATAAVTTNTAPWFANAGPERPTSQRPGQQVTRNLSHIPPTFPSPRTAEAIDAQAVPTSAASSRHQQLGVRVPVDFYLGPHGDCPVPREHGHAGGHGSLVFCADTRLAFSSNAEAGNEGEDGGGSGSYYLGLADGIKRGLQSVTNLSDSAFPNRGVNSAAAQPQPAPAFNGQWPNTTPRPPTIGNTTTTAPGGVSGGGGQSRPTLWNRAQNNNNNTDGYYGDYYPAGNNNHLGPQGSSGRSFPSGDVRRYVASEDPSFSNDETFGRRLRPRYGGPPSPYNARLLSPHNEGGGGGGGGSGGRFDTYHHTGGVVDHQPPNNNRVPPYSLHLPPRRNSAGAFAYPHSPPASRFNPSPPTPGGNGYYSSSSNMNPAAASFEQHGGGGGGGAAVGTTFGRLSNPSPLALGGLTRPQQQYEAGVRDLYYPQEPLPAHSQSQAQVQAHRHQHQDGGGGPPVLGAYYNSTTPQQSQQSQQFQGQGQGQASRPGSSAYHPLHLDGAGGYGDDDDDAAAVGRDLFEAVTYDLYHRQH